MKLEKVYMLDGSGSGYGYGSGSGYGYGYGSYFIKMWGEWFEVAGPLNDSLCRNIPDHHLNKINKAFIEEVTNLESLRTIRDRIGLEKYLSFFNARQIHSETDNQGNVMKLYKYDEKGTDVVLLEVVCPSTGRMYHLYPPNQRVKTCLEAKASTFGDRKLIYRHGDVGLALAHGDGVVTTILET